MVLQRNHEQISIQKFKEVYIICLHFCQFCAPIDHHHQSMQLQKNFYHKLADIFHLFKVQDKKKKLAHAPVE